MQWQVKHVDVVGKDAVLHKLPDDIGGPGDVVGGWVAKTTRTRFTHGLTGVSANPDSLPTTLAGVGCLERTLLVGKRHLTGERWASAAACGLAADACVVDSWCGTKKIWGGTA